VFVRADGVRGDSSLLDHQLFYGHRKTSMRARQDVEAPAAAIQLVEIVESERIYDCPSAATPYRRHFWRFAAESAARFSFADCAHSHNRRPARCLRAEN
jgi:hypothetical protein